MTISFIKMNSEIIKCYFRKLISILSLHYLCKGKKIVAQKSEHPLERAIAF
jgi:hypothetical protein